MTLREFSHPLPFALDSFQVQACQAVERGSSVLVAAPTGSGKTIVGEFAIHVAVTSGSKCFYTTPIKALSNQKFRDLVDRYGPEKVGLLTGDNSINGEAPIVVMTTEVLRNMLYAGSRTLIGLSHVVMDEVHYLADRARGAVWEEIIINLPESVAVISLSATVSNAEEFGEWLSEVRGDNVTIVEERRPVPLHQHVMVGKQMLDLFEGTHVNRNLEHFAREERGPQRNRGGQPRGRYRTPSRIDVIQRLEADGLLPAIDFVFSRAGCDAAVQQVMDAQLALTTSDEREEILRTVDAYCARLPEQDLEALGYESFRHTLASGVASHHAGMLPTFKECVEHLFARGFIKVVFATETLALGVNMPARTVVIERLSKWNGSGHVELTPGEYTQLTGRAGRRGLDKAGHGVVLWQEGLNPKMVAGLASTRTYPLTSSFRPSYNMAANLVSQSGRHIAREILELSFAQFQADRSVVGLARRIRKAEEALEAYSASATCHLGDFMEYSRLRRAIGEAEAEGARDRRAAQRRETLDSLGQLRRGDVIIVPKGKWAGPAVVLDPGAAARDDPRPYVLTVGRQARRLSVIDFTGPVEVRNQIRIPAGFNPRKAPARRSLAHTLRTVTTQASNKGGAHRGHPDAGGVSPRAAQLRRELRAHPCHDCPERESHARWMDRYFALDRATADDRRQVEQRTNSVAREFDRVCQVLTTLGYLDGDSLTEPGERLKRLYGELDLVVSESLRRGLWDELEPHELAAVVSGLTFTSRSSEDAHRPRFSSPRALAAADATVALHGRLAALERRHRLDFLRVPDYGFAEGAAMWASGDELDEVLAACGLLAGDFVRAVNQLSDLLAQIADAAGDSPLRATARHALGALRRGVVSIVNE